MVPPLMKKKAFELFDKVSDDESNPSPPPPFSPLTPMSCGPPATARSPPSSPPSWGAPATARSPPSSPPSSSPTSSSSSLGTSPPTYDPNVNSSDDEITVIEPTPPAGWRRNYIIPDSSSDEDAEDADGEDDQNDEGDDHDDNDVGAKGVGNSGGRVDTEETVNDGDHDVENEGVDDGVGRDELVKDGHADVGNQDDDVVQQAGQPEKINNMNGNVNNIKNNNNTSIDNINNNNINNNNNDSAAEGDDVFRSDTSSYSGGMSSPEYIIPSSEDEDENRCPSPSYAPAEPDQTREEDLRPTAEELAAAALKYKNDATAPQPVAEKYATIVPDIDDEIMMDHPIKREPQSQDKIQLIKMPRPTFLEQKNTPMSVNKSVPAVRPVNFRPVIDLKVEGTTPLRASPPIPDLEDGEIVEVQNKENSVKKKVPNSIWSDVLLGRNKSDIIPGLDGHFPASMPAMPLGSTVGQRPILAEMSSNQANWREAASALSQEPNKHDTSSKQGKAVRRTLFNERKSTIMPYRVPARRAVNVNAISTYNVPTASVRPVIQPWPQSVIQPDPGHGEPGPVIQTWPQSVIQPDPGHGEPGHALFQVATRGRDLQSHGDLEAGTIRSASRNRYKTEYVDLGDSCCLNDRRGICNSHMFLTALEQRHAIGSLQEDCRQVIREHLRECMTILPFPTRLEMTVDKNLVALLRNNSNFSSPAFGASVYNALVKHKQLPPMSFESRVEIRKPVPKYYASARVRYLKTNIFAEAITNRKEEKDFVDRVRKNGLAWYTMTAGGPFALAGAVGWSYHATVEVHLPTFQSAIIHFLRAAWVTARNCMLVLSIEQLLNCGEDRVSKIISNFVQAIDLTLSAGKKFRVLIVLPPKKASKDPVKYCSYLSWFAKDASRILQGDPGKLDRFAVLDMDTMINAVPPSISADPASRVLYEQSIMSANNRPEKIFTIRRPALVVLNNFVYTVMSEWRNISRANLEQQQHKRGQAMTPGFLSQLIHPFRWFEQAPEIFLSSTKFN